MKNPTLYDILGVSSSVSAADLKSAWRSRVQQYHPDKFEYGSPEAKEAEERIKMINAAYDTLKDPSKRAQYDRAEQAAAQKASTSGAGTQRHRPRQQQRTERPRTHRQTERSTYARTQSTGGPKTTDNIFDRFFGASKRWPTQPPNFGQGKRDKPRSRSQFDGIPSFDELRARMERDKPIFDQMRRQMERDKPIYDAMHERMRTDPIYDQMRRQMERNKPIFDAMRERMKTDPIFAELRQRMSSGQGLDLDWDSDDPEPS